MTITEATEATEATETSEITTGTTEQVDLLGALAQHRAFLLSTADGLTDAQAAHRSTASTLTIGGIIKHVTMTERGWVDFIVGGAEALAPGGEWNYSSYEDEFAMAPGETLADLVAASEATARRTERVVSGLESLDEAQLLPAAPWFPAGATWTMRMVLLHILAEIAQHAGHADIIRETIDGHRTMG